MLILNNPFEYYLIYFILQDNRKLLIVFIFILTTLPSGSRVAHIRSNRSVHRTRSAMSRLPLERAPS